MRASSMCAEDKPDCAAMCPNCYVALKAARKKTFAAFGLGADHHHPVPSNTQEDLDLVWSMPASTSMFAWFTGGVFVHAEDKKGRPRSVTPGTIPANGDDYYLNKRKLKRKDLVYMQTLAGWTLMSARGTAIPTTAWWPPSRPGCQAPAALPFLRSLPLAHPIEHVPVAKDSMLWLIGVMHLPPRPSTATFGEEEEGRHHVDVHGAIGVVEDE